MKPLQRKGPSLQVGGRGLFTVEPVVPIRSSKALPNEPMVRAKAAQSTDWIREP